MATWDLEQISTKLKQLKTQFASLQIRDIGDNYPIGLDIGNESLKLIRIDTSAKPYIIKNFATTSLPIGYVEKGEIKNIDGISKALKTLVTDAGINIKNVAISIPRSLAIIKTILVSGKLNSSEIDSRAWIEAKRHFPDLMGDIYFDYAIINKGLSGRHHDDMEQSELILVAGRKEQIKPYLSIIENAGLTLKLVDINCYALERALYLLQDSISQYKTVALLNINASLISLIVTHNGKMIHAHDESFDGQLLLNEINDYLRENNLAAHVNSEHLINDNLYNAILRNNLISHLRHIVQLIYSSKPDIQIELIVFAGDCASIPALAAFTQQEIGAPSIIANPFKDMKSESHINLSELHENAANLMLCTGLALSKIVAHEEATNMLEWQ